MASRDAVAAGLIKVRTWWKSLEDSESALADVVRKCEPYDDAEFALGVQRLIDTWRPGYPPKPADFADACAAIAKVRRADVIAQHAHRSHAYCPFCGTTTLEWSPLWPVGRARMVPRHAPDCQRVGAEAETAAPVNMAAWPSDRKPARRTENAVVGSHIGAAVARIAPETARPATIPPAPDPDHVSSIPEPHNGV